MKPIYFLALALLCGCSPVARDSSSLEGYIVSNTNDPDWSHYHWGVDRSEMPEGYKLLSNGKKWNYQVGLWEGLFERDSRAEAIAAAWKYCDDDLEMRKHPMVEVKPPSQTNSQVSDKDFEFDNGAFWAYMASGRHEVTNFGELRMWAHIERANAVKLATEINAAITNK